MAEKRQEPKGVPMDYVYAGRRMSTKGTPLHVIFQIVNEDGTLTPGKRRVLDSKAIKRAIVGGVYTGARFDDQYTYGLPSVRWKGMWHDAVAVAGWKGEDNWTEQELANRRAQERYKDPLHEQLLPIRRTIHALQKRGQHNAAVAYRDLVFAEIFRPLTKEEKES